MPLQWLTWFNAKKTMDLNDVAIVPVREIDYRIHFWHMSKDDAMNKMKNSNLDQADYYEFFHYI